MQNRKRLFSRLKNDYIFFIVNQIEDSEGNDEWYRCESIKLLFFLIWGSLEITSILCV